MSQYNCAEESLDRSALEALQQRKLRTMLEAVLPANGFFRRKYAAAGVEALRAPLLELPFVTREELQADQAARPPYGTLPTYEIARYCRYHQTSGSSGVPLRLLDSAEDWAWWRDCWATIYLAMGLGAEDRVIFTFSFGPFIGFWAAFEAAVMLGNLSLPGGGLSTRARLEQIVDLGATVVCCTPTYALRMAEVAEEEGIDLARSAVRGLIVAGEPGGNIPAVRARLESAWGARVYDHAGMSEVGPYGFECHEAPGGIHVSEHQFIAEVVDPASGEAVEDGNIGELVLTNLGRLGLPMIRYRTGDLVRRRRGRCACGRSFARLDGGLLGRRDEMFVIRGNNVYPTVVEDILRGFGDLAEFRLRVTQRGALCELQIEVEPVASADGVALAGRVESAVRDRLHFRPEVVLVAPGALPRFEMKSRRVVRAAERDAD